MPRRWGALVWGALALAGAPSCQSPALVRTARTLPAGGHDVSLSLNVTRVSLEETGIDVGTLPLADFNLPNPVPDILYAHGLTDDLELGARLGLGSGLLELNAKYRFLTAASDSLHLALAPAAGYRVLLLVNGPVLTLPLLITYDAAPDISVSGGPLVSYASYAAPDSLEAGDLDLQGDTLYAGGGIGIELRPLPGLHVMPAVEVQRSLSRRGAAESLPRVDMLLLGITFGWGTARRSEPLSP